VLNPQFFTKSLAFFAGNQLTPQKGYDIITLIIRLLPQNAKRGMSNEAIYLKAAFPFTRAADGDQCSGHGCLRG
jgi:hypothetical protein